MPYYACHKHRSQKALFVVFPASANYDQMMRRHGVCCLLINLFNCSLGEWIFSMRLRVRRVTVFSVRSRSLRFVVRRVRVSSLYVGVSRVGVGSGLIAG